MRLPCTPLISKGWTVFPSKTNDNDSNTSVFGCGRDGNLELQLRRRGDLDFELCAHTSPHGADDTSVSDQDHRVLNGPAW